MAVDVSAELEQRAFREVENERIVAAGPGMHCDRAAGYSLMLGKAECAVQVDRVLWMDSRTWRNRLLVAERRVGVSVGSVQRTMLP
jgi:hypothetical protein